MDMPAPWCIPTWFLEQSILETNILLQSLASKVLTLISWKIFNRHGLIELLHHFQPIFLMWELITTIWSQVCYTSRVQLLVHLFLKSQIWTRLYLDMIRSNLKKKTTVRILFSNLLLVIRNEKYWLVHLARNALNGEDRGALLRLRSPRSESRRYR